MKRIAALLLCLLLLPGGIRAESVSFGAVSFPEDAESIDLGDQVVEDWKEFISFLGQFPNLRRVDMYATTVEKRQADRLAETFPGVRFGWTIHITFNHYIRTDQTAFSTLHGQCVAHPSSVFSVLRYCTELRALDLGHNKVVDLSFLEPLVHLRVLILACNPDLKNIQVLSGLKELEYLELFSTKVADLSPLGDLPNLMDLNISNTRVRRWDVLLGMPQLRRLWIAVSDKNAELLRAALPDAKVVNHGQPTGSGWRILEDGTEDPHYAVVYRMFRENRYIPFSDSAPLPEAKDEEDIPRPETEIPEE